VAVDCRWDRLTFLAQTCVKAGLPPLAWKDEDALIYTFTADIFSDHPEQPRHPK
jgi:AMMECR1 domain-containing protein